MYLKNSKIIVIKIGSSLLVDENKTILTHYAVYFEDGVLLDTSLLNKCQKGFSLSQFLDLSKNVVL